MKKPWSIATALRNPYRLQDFLRVLKKIDGYEWSFETQKMFQIFLIQERLYGYGHIQFYNGLSDEQVDILNDSSRIISFKEAESIFNIKNYEDPAMRGRQSFNPLKKLGFVIIKNGRISITKLGSMLLDGSQDLGDVFFRCFLKWQIPAPNNKSYSDNNIYDIKPFIGVLHLINAVNKIECLKGNKPKGISKREFSLFAPTLINYKDIEFYAEEIIKIRSRSNIQSNFNEKQNMFNEYQHAFVENFFGISNTSEINKKINNLHDYADNAIRYFRLTRLIYIRGNGFFIDLEPRRSIEISSLLEYDNAQSVRFATEDDYLNYLSDISKPNLPWENKAKYIKIIENLVREINEYELHYIEDSSDEVKCILNNTNFSIYDEAALKNYIVKLKALRKDLQNKAAYNEAQDIGNIKSCILDLDTIYQRDNKSILLEKYASFGLQALNDAIKIKPNYPVGDDNEPTFHAPANIPDIECYYEKYNAICEVTMLKSRDQWYYEGQPVMRHLRDFEEKSNKNVYCIFIAPKIHRDTINTFWIAIKYGYEGKTQQIIPLSIKNFIELLDILIELKVRNRKLSHLELANLFNSILEASNEYTSSCDWLGGIPNIIKVWKKSLGL